MFFSDFYIFLGRRDRSSCAQITSARWFFEESGLFSLVRLRHSFESTKFRYLLPVLPGWKSWTPLSHMRRTKHSDILSFFDHNVQVNPHSLNDRTRLQNPSPATYGFLAPKPACSHPYKRKTRRHDVNPSNRGHADLETLASPRCRVGCVCAWNTQARYQGSFDDPRRTA